MIIIIIIQIMMVVFNVYEICQLVLLLTAEMPATKLQNSHKINTTQRAGLLQ